MRRESLQAQERHAHAARDSVEAGQALASLGVFASLWVANPRKGRLWLKTESCWRSANTNDETERQLPGPQRAGGNGLF